MKVLALNCGSSSIKFQVVAIDPRAGSGRSDERLAGGSVERIGRDASVTVHVEGQPLSRTRVPILDHESAVRYVLEWIKSGEFPVEAIGHRVVHGGARFTRPVVLNDTVTSTIEALEELAPLHNAPSLAGIRAARAALGAKVPMVAVFDTGFHAALPEHAASYAIPHELAAKYGIRRYGFHGISYRHVVSRYCSLAGIVAQRASLVAFHLGNGCSAVAIQGGTSLDTSMGFTPLEGLVMGTRSGDLDPSIISYLANRESMSTPDVERLLNERSGLLGLSGRSSDMRHLLEHAPVDPRARLAIEVFCHRARKYLGAYLAVLGGADAVVFTGGIGEHSPEIRARICAGMEWCGLTLDPFLNSRTLAGEGEISVRGSRLRVFVIPADEELLIAHDTVTCLDRSAT